jgi:hypothetical protein
MTTKSQCQQVADYLRTGAPLTAHDALRMWGCFRLAARVDNLRHSGMNIVTTMIEVAGVNGKARVAEYRLGVASNG